LNRLIKLGALATIFAGLLVVAAIPSFYVSEKGGQLVMELLSDRIPGLIIAPTSGSLNKTINTPTVQWRAPNNTIVTAKSVSARWSLDCLWRRELCFRELLIDTLLIEPPKTGSSQPDKLPALAKLYLENPIVADRVLINRFELLSADGEPFTLNNIEFSGNWHASELHLNQAGFEWNALRLSGEARMQFVKNYPLQAQFLASGDIAQNPFTGQLGLHGDLYTTNFAVRLSQPADSTISGEIQPLKRGMPISGLQADWQNLIWHSPGPVLLSQSGRATAAGVLDRLFLSVDGQLRSDQIPPTKFSMMSELGREYLKLNSAFASNPLGDFQAQGELQWQNEIRWNGQIEVSDMQLPQLQNSDLEIHQASSSVLASWTDGEFQFQTDNLNATASVSGQLFTASGDVALLPDRTVHFREIDIFNNHTEIQLTGQLGEESQAVLSLNRFNLNTLLPGSTGDIQGRISIAGNAGSQDITADLQSKSIFYGDTFIEGMKFKTSLKDMAGASSSITATADQITHAGRNFSAFEVLASGTKDQHDIQLRVSEESGIEAALAASGAIQEWRQWRGSIENSQLELFDESASLQDPITLDWSLPEKELILGPHCWSLNQASICLDQPATVAEQGEIGFSVRELQLDAISATLANGLKVKGTANSNGTISWDKNGISDINLQTAVDNAIVSGDETSVIGEQSIHVDKLSLNAMSRSDTITTAMKLQSPELGTLGIEAVIANVAAGWPIVGTATLQDTRLDLISRFLPQLHELTGTAAGKATFSGSILSPEVTGEIIVSDTSFQAAETGLQISLPQSTLRFDNNQVDFNGEGTASDAPVSFSGSALLAPSGLTMQAHLKSRSLPVDTQLLHNATLDTDLQISLQDNTLKTTGQVLLHSAELTIDDFFNDGVLHSADIAVIGESRTAPADPQGSLQIVHDIDLHLGDDVRLKGFGLNAILSGKLSTSITDQASPQIHGLLTLENGSYRSYGQDLIIREGRISFIGAPGQATFYVEATRQIENLSAGVRVEGALQNPAMTLFSEPTMPEEEILSYIVMGRSLDQKSDRQAQLMANAALYVGLKNGDRISSRIKQIFGIKDFFINASGEGDSTRVMLSGRLTNRLLLRYGIGIFEPVNTLYLRYELAERLYIETTRGIERAVDLYYSFLF